MKSLEQLKASLREMRLDHNAQFLSGRAALTAPAMLKRERDLAEEIREAGGTEDDVLETYR